MRAVKFHAFVFVSTLLLSPAFAADTAALQLYQYSAAPSTGKPVSITVQAVDAGGRVVKDYAGTVRVTTTDTQATTPADYTFSASNNGAHTFNIAFCRAGTHTVTIQDTSNAALTSTRTCDVSLKQFSNIAAWGDDSMWQLGDGRVGTAIGISGAISISTGFTHSIALLSDGSVWAWGTNEFGQLGRGDLPDDIIPPTEILNISDVAAIAAGAEHSLALKNDGTVWAWGYNGNGQIGNNSMDDAFVPMQVVGLANIVAIGAGDNFSAAVKADGTVWMWGGNEYGQLGNGSFDDALTPVQVPNLSGVVAIDGGAAHTLALKNDGTVLAWGLNDAGQLGIGSIDDSSVPVAISNFTDVISVSAALTHSIVLKNDGTVWTFGTNDYGELGDGSGRERHAPVKVNSLENMIAISGGDYHSAAIKQDGTVWVWGSDLGFISVDFAGSETPVQLDGIEGAVALSDSSAFLEIIRADGSVYGRGERDYGQLGFIDGFDGHGMSNAPLFVESLSGVVAVAGGEFHSIVLRNDGTVWGFGEGDMIGFDFFEKDHSSIPVKIPVLHDIVAIASSQYLNIALQSDGTVWHWGDVQIPEIVVGISDVTMIACGRAHFLALTSDGNLWAWGDNDEGQLGLGNIIDHTDTPLRVGTLSNVIAMAAGLTHSLAVTSDGKVWAWGDNTSDKLGVNSFELVEFAPKEVPLAGIATRVAAGANHSLALTNDGSVWSWGDNSKHQLGGAAGSSLPNAQKIAALSNVASISAGGDHSLALLANGTLMSWGDNANGQNGNTGDGSSPTSVVGISNVIAFACGTYHSLAAIGSPTATKLTVDAPAIAFASQPFDIHILATDDQHNQMSFTGGINLSSSDPSATLPQTISMTGVDGGSMTVTVVLLTSGTQTITATSAANNSISGSATLEVSNRFATVTFGDLFQAYDGSPKPATIVTDPAAVEYLVTYGGSAEPPTNPGEYFVEVTVTQPFFNGSGSATLTIVPTAAVTLNASAPKTNEVLTATAAAGGSANATLTYVWQVDGTTVRTLAGTTNTTDTLDLSVEGNGNHSDVITVSVTASDNNLGSQAAIASATVANTIPTATVSLNTSSPKTGDTLTATATSADVDGDVVNLTYVWKVNGTTKKTTTLSSSLTDTFDLSAGGNGDNGDQISVEVTPNDGTAGARVSANAQILSSAPSILSTPTANPNPAYVAQSIQFGVAGTDPDNDPLTYSWSFGDGATATGATPTHKFASAGNFTVDVTLSDGFATAKAVVSVTVLAPLTAVVTKGSVRFNFKTPKNDTLKLTGTIPIQSAFNFSTATVGVVAGSFEVSGMRFTKTTAASGKTVIFKLVAKQDKTTRAVITPSEAKYTLTIKTPQLYPSISGAGFVNASVKTQPVQFTTYILINGVEYAATGTFSYTAKVNKGGGGKF